ncbi:hypothetical protein L1987_25558 [Smallanthus sonchifolius]|uniref:Uncharacterized protein n=2 Tax=Smallanthus sonchifolius TaxID=185202 RepID=A0ACB9INK2_9ASTR|nr:hypothetical protein L1987_25558 [Smallanthus sonchifolius]
MTTGRINQTKSDIDRSRQYHILGRQHRKPKIRLGNISLSSQLRSSDWPPHVAAGIKSLLGLGHWSSGHKSRRHDAQACVITRPQDARCGAFSRHGASSQGHVLHDGGVCKPYGLIDRHHATCCTMWGVCKPRASLLGNMLHDVGRLHATGFVTRQHVARCGAFTEHEAFLLGNIDGDTKPCFRWGCSRVDVRENQVAGEFCRQLGAAGHLVLGILGSEGLFSESACEKPSRWGYDVGTTSWLVTRHSQTDVWDDVLVCYKASKPCRAPRRRHGLLQGILKPTGRMMSWFVTRHWDDVGTKPCRGPRRRSHDELNEMAESQWIVAARPLCHLQYPVTYLSRLQRILPVA